MIFAALALAIGAPSFDCGRASTIVEKMICADAELAALDRAIARLYAGVPRADRTGNRVGGLWRKQADWLKERDHCAAKKCLTAIYDERLFDLFTTSQTPTREYQSKEVNGTMSILDVGGGWYAFLVQGLWIGSNPGQVNTDIQYGHFKLAHGKAAQAPGEDCGWQIQRLSRDRWQFTELMSDDRSMIGCGGLNATATGIYSR